MRRNTQIQERSEVPGLLRESLEPMRVQLLGLNAAIAQLEGRIAGWHQHDQASRRLAEVPGVGLLTATAAVATIGDAKVFDSGRGFAAWLGITPGQHSSGGKQRLLGITKRGDARLRTLFIHGARSVVRAHRPGSSPWLDALLAPSQERGRGGCVPPQRAHRLGLARQWPALRRTSPLIDPQAPETGQHEFAHDVRR